MKLIRGEKISEKILKNLKNRMKKEKANPGLAVILVGKNSASEIYVRLKEMAAQNVGIRFYLYKFSEKTKEADIIKKIKTLNSDKKISGIIVQLPLPQKFNTQKIINAIDPKKDADGFHPRNLKLFLEGGAVTYPVFPQAIMKMIASVPGAELRKKAVVVAKSKKFGETMKAALQQKEIRTKYVLAKELSKNIQETKKADIVVTAVGKPGLIKGGMIKEGAIIIDGGIVKKGKKVLGDVDFESVKNKASFISPVPGGVGPVTIACLLENVYLLSKKSL